MKVASQNKANGRDRWQKKEVYLIGSSVDGGDAKRKILCALVARNVRSVMLLWQKRRKKTVKALLFSQKLRLNKPKYIKIGMNAQFPARRSR